MSKDTGLLEYLSKASATLPEETVHVEAWGRDVVLRGMTSRERDLFEETQLRRANAKAGNGAARKRGDVQADLSNFRARLVACHVIEGGMRTLANPNGEELLGNQPAAVVDKLFAVAQRLSGFSPEDVEALSKNSEPTGDSEQSTGSQPASESQSVN